MGKPKKRVKPLLCDTNIAVEMLRNRAWALGFLTEYGSENLAFSLISHAEVLLGRSKQEHRTVKNFLRNFRTYDLDAGVSKVFRELIHTHHGHGSGWMPDALIAATALHNGLDRYTLNRGDFEFIAGLRLHAPAG